jgi:hypothetical protein
MPRAGIHAFVPSESSLADLMGTECAVCGENPGSLIHYAVSITEPKSTLPTDSKSRKEVPLATGVLDYFSSALAEVAKVSRQGNLQHNGPDSPLHWAREKSGDQADALLRHMVERGSKDTDGMYHSAKLAWRALAILQLELEAEGAPIARAAKPPEQR